MKKGLLLLIVLFTAVYYPAAQDAPVIVDTTVYYPEEPVEFDYSSITGDEQPEGFNNPILRRLSDDSISAFKQQKDFAYMQYIDSFFRNGSYTDPVAKENTRRSNPWLFKNPGMRTLYWLIAFAAIILLLWKLFFGKSSVFTTNRKLQTSGLEEEDHEVGETPAETLIGKAIAEKNYRLAIRYLYLQTLALLGEKGLIAIAPQKTNHHYVNELSGNKLQPLFSRLTLHYEYAWYGEFTLTPQQFDGVYSSFKNFNSGL